MTMHLLTKRLRGLAVLPFLALAMSAPPALSETDFGDVAFYAGNLLRNNHYLKGQVDSKELSDRLLKTYLEWLDPSHFYFTQEDIDGFKKSYGQGLVERLEARDIAPAKEIYQLFEARMKDRIGKIKDLLANGKFDFASNKTVKSTRKEAAWPKDMAAADELWRDMVEGELLQEKLRQESIAERVKEKEAKKAEKAANAEPKPADPAKPLDTAAAEPKKEDEKPPDPAKPEDTPEQKIGKRFDRFLESWKDTDDEDIANWYLTAFATSYDPHSDYMSFREMEAFQSSMSKSLQGIGALLSSKDGVAEIQGIVVGGPADKSGLLKVGDKIVAVGQGKSGEMVDITYQRLDKVVEMIRGAKDTIVRLKVIPAGITDGSVTKEIEIVREEVHLKDQLATADLVIMKDPNGRPRKLGWLTLPSFYADMQGGTTSMTADVNLLLQRLMKEGIEGLAIDLRDDGGGSLEEAIKFTGLFIKRGPVVQSRDSHGVPDIKQSRNRNPIYDGPLVVVTNQVSASASEIVAAALQDYGRAVIIGGKSTFGKGTVQTIMPVARKMPFFSQRERAGSLKLTIQKFYRISGGSTQRKGVIPDIILPTIYDALEKGEASLDYALEYDQIDKLDYRPTLDQQLPLQRLSALSMPRVSSDRDFQYLNEDIARVKEQMDKNEISLNIESRRNETAKVKERTKLRNAERKERFAKLEKEAGDGLKVYKLTLDNVAGANLTPRSQFTKEDDTGMRLGKQDDEDEDESLEYPFGFDPTKRESLNVLSDLIDLTAKKDTASINPPAGTKPAPN